MITVFAIHAPDTAKLELIVQEMRALGAPTIKVVDCGDHYMALEGSHRLAAAHSLGIAPNLIIHEQDAQIDISGYDWFEPQNWADTIYPAGEIAGEIFSAHQAVAYTFPS